MSNQTSESVDTSVANHFLEIPDTRTSMIKRATDTPEQADDRGPIDANVMVVDDESFNIDLVQAYLEEEGFGNFITTTDASAALGMVRDHRPDIVLLDVKITSVPVI